MGEGPARYEAGAWGVADRRAAGVAGGRGHDGLCAGKESAVGLRSGDGEGRVLVVVNKGDKPETVDLPMSHTALAECRKVSALWGAEGLVGIKADTLHVVISPGSVEIVNVN